MKKQFLLIPVFILLLLPVSNAACTPEWRCSGWSECLKGNHIRICNDLNSCQEEKIEEKSCGEVKAAVIAPFFSSFFTSMYFLGFITLVIGGFVLYFASRKIIGHYNERKGNDLKAIRRRLEKLDKEIAELSK